MARHVFKILIIVLIIGTLMATWSATAFMPSERNVSYPKTVWSDRGIKGSVEGKVVTSLDQNTGVGGAYVAVVDVTNPNREYANTTSNANGDFSLSGLSATYSTGLTKGPDGTAGTFYDGQRMYMIYVNESTLGEGFSETFGIDTNHTSKSAVKVVIYAGIASPEPTPEPTAVPVTATPVPPTAEPPTATPAPTGQSPVDMILFGALVIALAIVAVAIYLLFLRKKKR